ncbi:glycoside hydrolase family 3 N-terminal domain-containing protein [Aliiglaciecola sp. LCG003]|uniref:glycoside hydrolase family 3 N-terminal domain-containing protein n=1 Tax=Aliiglaciecola sp. LCG003 TaxID=3053655 RepID=UPI002573F5EC|nr:glycoside hydrolase family 3 N-terminal domain-containing protein [Aliiglaciecola sp. LCG003]WJG10124.1 glycoside hydrolase family 3 N-terminal domain-containing protein [Aliiglaciecola sp. LCG003]
MHSETSSVTSVLGRPYSPRVMNLLAKMTIQQKIGQLSQLSGNEGKISQSLEQRVKQGLVGSVINEVDPEIVKALQQLAIQHSPLGIPLLIGRDVIHGFKTIFPIPLGQAASWSPEWVEKAAKIAAQEASMVGINWTFAPMIDISRDPRWGRIAESLGEDPYLCSVLGNAMVKGFQGDDMSGAGAIAACAKHFAGYGAVESGRDYATTNIPEHELRNVYLPPFHAAAKTGVATFMASFSDLNGVPASGNAWLMKTILRDEWQFSGFVVSDWESISQLQIHGISANDRDSACQAFNAGIDMEMVSSTYHDHLHNLLDIQQVSPEELDASVAKILSLKEQLGLFDQPLQQIQKIPQYYQPDHLAVAKTLVQKSCVLLQNHQQRLPLAAKELSRIAVIGPLADDGYEQMGTWVFDGEAQQSVTCLDALRDYLPNDIHIDYASALETTRSTSTAGFAEAIKLTQQADVALLFLGEESILSGEAHCRADIGLPGAQQQLIEQLALTGTALVLIIMAGRPLTLEPIIDKVDSILYAWHPGTMAGPAITELLFGELSPSGKLPVTFPRKVGQIPIFYNHKHSGKPVSEAQFVYIDDIAIRSPQTSLGMASNHLDTHFTPLYEFGFGLSYSLIHYDNLSLNRSQIKSTEVLIVSVEIHNTGRYAVDEIAQLYVRDLVANVTRPVKELKQFTTIRLLPGQSKQVQFHLTADELGFYGRDMQFIVEAGQFHLWVGGSSATQLRTEFELLNG